MHKTLLNGSGFLALLIAGSLLSAPAFAEKPEWAGNDGGKQKHHKKYKKNQQDKHNESRDEHDNEHGDDVNINVDVHFGDRERVVVHDYYEERYRKGRCPPGLAKKNNGCQPPGQAKKWKKGYPLPREVVYHDLPPRIIIDIGLPPAGHKYVRVAADILLIAVGTGIVIDAIEDLGRI